MASEIKFVCPRCAQRMEASPEDGGKIIDCPSCGRRMRIPEYDSADPIKKMFYVVASPVGPFMPKGQSARSDSLGRKEPLQAVRQQ